MTHPEDLVTFFKLVTEEMQDEDVDNDALYSLLEPILIIIQKDLQQGTILILPMVAINTLEAFSKIPEFAMVCNNNSSNLNKKSIFD